MGRVRICPGCGAHIGFWAIRMPGWWDTSVFCRGCGTAFQFSLGWSARLLKFVLCAGLVVSAYGVTRPVPAPWAFVAFFLLLAVGGLPVLLLVRWYLYGTAALTPMPRDTPRSGTTGAAP